MTGWNDDLTNALVDADAQRNSGGLAQQLGASFGGLQQALGSFPRTLGVVTGLSQNIAWNNSHVTLLEQEQLARELPLIHSVEERWLRGRIQEICQYGVQ